MNKLLPGIVVFLLLIQSTSCSVGKKPTRKKVIVDSTAITKVQDSIKAQQQLNDSKKQLVENLTGLWTQQIAFNTFNAKVKAHFESPEEKHDFTVNIRIEKDKTIWAFVTAMGMVNVARIVITPDSFKMINYLDNKVKLMALKDADTLLPIPVDFQYLQNMLIGNVLKQGGTITDANDFGGTWSLQAEESEMVQQYAYNKSDSSMRSAQLSSKKEAGTQITIQLGNYALTNGRKFSNSRAINMMNEGKSYYLDMNFNKVDFDEPVDFPFNIPKKYEVNGVKDEADKPSPGERKAQRKEHREENRQQRRSR